MTTDIVLRIGQHRDKTYAGFTQTHGITALVWYEALSDITTAITREKSIKRWRRSWKMALIEATDPKWKDLWPTLFGSDVGLPLLRKPGPGSSPG